MSCFWEFNELRKYNGNKHKIFMEFAKSWFSILDSKNIFISPLKGKIDIV